MRAWPAAFLLVASLSAPLAAQAPTCVVTSIETSDFGSACGLGGPAFLTIAFDPAQCVLRFKVGDASSGAISNHFVLYGVAPLPSPFPLPPPSWGGDCRLDIFPLDMLGPFLGADSAVVLPPNPALAGATLVFEAIPEYAVAAPFPAFGATQGVKVAFH